MAVYAPRDFNMDNLFIGVPESEAIEKGGKKIQYFRIKLWDEKVDERLHIQPHKLFSYGVQESKSMEDDTKITGYECSFVLISKVNDKVVIRQDEDENDIPPTWVELGANPDEIAFLTMLGALHKKCSKAMFENKKKIGLGHIRKLEDMEGTLSPPWHWQKDKDTKNPNYTKTPTLKAKLIVGMKNGVKMYTRFYDAEDEKLNVMDYVGERFNAIPALAFESIYIGDKYFTFQIKLPEAVIYPAETGGGKRLLRHVTSTINNMTLTDKNDGENVSDSTEAKDSKKKEKTSSVDKSPKKEEKKSSAVKQVIRPKSKTASDQVNNLLGADNDE